MLRSMCPFILIYARTRGKLYFIAWNQWNKNESWQHTFLWLSNHCKGIKNSSPLEGVKWGVHGTLTNKLKAKNFKANFRRLGDPRWTSFQRRARLPVSWTYRKLMSPPMLAVDFLGWGLLISLWLFCTDFLPSDFISLYEHVNRRYCMVCVIWWFWKYGLLSILSRLWPLGVAWFIII